MDSQVINFINPIVEILEKKDTIDKQERVDTEFDTKKKNILIYSNQKKKITSNCNEPNGDIQIEFDLINENESINSANFFLYENKNNVYFRSKALPNIQIEVNRIFRPETNDNEDTDVKMQIYEQILVTDSKNAKDEERYICSEKLFTGVYESSQNTEFFDPENNKISLSVFNLDTATK